METDVVNGDFVVGFLSWFQRNLQLLPTDVDQEKTKKTRC